LDYIRPDACAINRQPVTMMESVSPPNFFDGVLPDLVMTPDPLCTPDPFVMTPDPLMTPDPFGNERGAFPGKKHVVDLIHEFGGSEKVPLILSQVVAEELYKYGIEFEVSNRSSRTKTRKSPRRKEDANGIHVSFWRSEVILIARLRKYSVGNENNCGRCWFIIASD
jgi:hypothetical protein